MYSSSYESNMQKNVSHGDWGYVLHRLSELEKRILKLELQASGQIGPGDSDYGTDPTWPKEDTR